MNGPFRIVSLCSGIGGLELGLERAGLGQVVVQVEIDETCRRVLARHWPSAHRHDDLKTWDCQVPGSGPILLCGGFPCQPYSKAGAGLAEQDPRDLWPDFARTIRKVGPEIVVLENVDQLLARGLGRVLGDLAALGYDAEWDCIPAAAVGAPHLRDRVFIVAYGNGRRHLHRPPAEFAAIGGKPALSLSRGGSDALADTDRERWVGQPDPSSRDDQNGHDPGRPEEAGRVGECGSPVADSNGVRRREPGHGASSEPTGRSPRLDSGVGGREWALADPRGIRYERQDLALFAGRNAVEPGGQWTIEPSVGRVANGVPGRVDRLRQLGNSVVPQVAEFIGWRVRTMIEPFASEGRSS